MFVGDWQVKDDYHETDTRVFTPDRLAQYTRSQQSALKHIEIELIASHLEGMGADVWRRQGDAFSKTYRVIATDSRSYG